MIVEISQFSLVDGTDEEEFLRAAEETHTGYLQQQAGFHSRELLRADDGSWMDLVRFDSLESAQQAIHGFFGHPSARAFEAMLDVSNVTMSHWSQAPRW